jgi:SAM-dependent methyltransferase
MIRKMARYTEYDAFAWVYNKYWGGDSAQRFFPVLERLLLPHLPSRARILDLCCGTGQLAQALAQRGFQVTGIDSSEEMIRLARTNAPAVEFLVEDARSFHLPAIYHAVVSTYDSLNHVMSPEDLSDVFRNVYACLRQGGLFLFDLNMEEGYKARWRGSFGIVEDNHVCVVRASFDEDKKVGRTVITIFRLEGVWHRSDVTLLQRCYSESEIRSGLEAAGFTDIQTFDAQHDLGWSREVGRVFFLSRRADGESGGG